MNFNTTPDYTPFKLQDNGYWKSTSHIRKDGNDFLGTSNRNISAYGRKCNALPGLIARLLDEKFSVVFTSKGEDIFHDFKEIFEDAPEAQFSKEIIIHGADVFEMKAINEQILMIELAAGDVVYINYLTLEKVDAKLNSFSQFVSDTGEDLEIPPLATVKIGPSSITSVIDGDPFVRKVEIETIDSMYVWSLFETDAGVCQDIGNFKALGAEQLTNSPEEERVKSLLDINQSFFEAGYYATAHRYLSLDGLEGLSWPVAVNPQAHARGNGEAYLRALTSEDTVE